jgi:hypothetical protein
MPKLTINTKSSLYDPIEIDINGETYSIKNLNTEFFEKADKFDQMVIDGNLKGNSLFLHECLGVPLKLARRLDFRTINKIKTFITEALTNAEPKNVGSGGKEETK